MYQFFILFLGTAVTVATSITESNYCRISINTLDGDLSEPQPLILTDTEIPTFVIPSERELLVIPSNSSILLACPGRNNSFDHFEPTQILKARCVKEKSFLVSTEIYSFNTFKCKRLPEESVKKTNDFCLDKHQKYEIGFEIGNSFLNVLEVCRDEISYRVYFSKHILIKEINNQQRKYKRPQWKYSSFYPGLDINKIYTFKSELQQVGTILGSLELAQKYIYYDKDNVANKWQSFHRGHLTPKADFVYGAQQSATFWLLNANPQWGSFNSGNWMYLESNVRKLAAARQIDLVVYTGVHGITTLKDINNNEQMLYLHGSKTAQILPVPRFYWKVIHDPVSNRATAFVGVNEVYADKITDDMYLCPDITDDYDFSWLFWQPNNITLGFSYICTVESLRDVVPSVPEIGNTEVFV